MRAQKSCFQLFSGPVELTLWLICINYITKWIHVLYYKVILYLWGGRRNLSRLWYRRWSSVLGVNSRIRRRFPEQWEPVGIQRLEGRLLLSEPLFLWRTEPGWVELPWAPLPGAQPHATEELLLDSWPTETRVQSASAQRRVSVSTSFLGKIKCIHIAGSCMLVSIWKTPNHQPGFTRH